MDTVKLSPKYQVVIPKKIRKYLKLEPGQKIRMITMKDRIEMIPERSVKDMRGYLKGINTEFTREDDRI
ncbi:AbrB/MazE/SpoVT family DNA-binding domain-containing protein [candidate division KSB1 bacterium]